MASVEQVLAADVLGGSYQYNIIFHQHQAYLGEWVALWGVTARLSYPLYLKYPAILHQCSASSL